MLDLGDSMSLRAFVFRWNWGLLPSCHVFPTMDGNTKLSRQALKRKKQLCPDLEKKKKLHVQKLMIQIQKFWQLCRLNANDINKIKAIINRTVLRTLVNLQAERTCTESKIFILRDLCHLSCFPLIQKRQIINTKETAGACLLPGNLSPWNSVYSQSCIKSVQTNAQFKWVYSLFT